MLSSTRNFQKGLNFEAQGGHFEKSGRKAGTVKKKNTKHSQAVTLASYQLVYNIAQVKKPYNEGDSVK